MGTRSDSTQAVGKAWQLTGKSFSARRAADALQMYSLLPLSRFWKVCRHSQRKQCAFPIIRSNTVFFIQFFPTLPCAVLNLSKAVLNCAHPADGRRCYTNPAPHTPGQTPAAGSPASLHPDSVCPADGTKGVAKLLG